MTVQIIYKNSISKKNKFHPGKQGEIDQAKKQPTAGSGATRDSGPSLDSASALTLESLSNIQYELLVALQNKAVFHASVERRYDLARLSVDVVGCERGKVIVI